MKVTGYLKLHPIYQHTIYQDKACDHNRSSHHALVRLPSSSFSAIDKHWMTQALVLAKKAASIGEVPVGAVIVYQGKIIGEGYNCPISTYDPTAHAEVCALRNACQHIKNYRLPEGCTLYVTLEPCTQCVGALVHARIARVVFAATEPKAGSLTSARQLLQNGYFNHVFNYAGGLLHTESKLLLQSFFKARRLQKANAK